MQFNLTKNQKIIIFVLAGVLVLTGIIGGSVAIANAAKRKQQAACEHVYDEGTIKSEATCEQPGMIVYTCETCDYEQTEEIPANGHVEITIEAYNQNGVLVLSDVTEAIVKCREKTIP